MILLILTINFVLTLLMYIIRPIVVVVKRMPRLYGFTPGAFNFMFFVVMPAKTYHSLTLGRTLRHEFRHLKDCRLFTPLVFGILYGIFVVYTFIRYRDMLMMYRGANPFETRAMKAENGTEPIMDYWVVYLA